MEIIAHRGASFDAPENTLAAAKLAWAQGADALEMDIRLTADGHLVVIHDETTQRLAGVALMVSKTNLAALAGLDVGRWKDPRYAGEKIATLDEVLATVPPGKRVFIEIKGGPEAVVELKRCVGSGHLNPEQVVIIGFDFVTITAAKKALPHCAAGWILDYAAGSQPPLAEVVSQCQAGGLNGLDLNMRWPIDATVVKQVHRAGLRLDVWTVDDPVLARRLGAAGVDGITTNRPGWLRQQLAN